MFESSNGRRQLGVSLLSLLLGLVLSLALLLLWQRLLTQAQTAAAVQQQRATAFAELQWLQGQLQQDFLAQANGPCVGAAGQALDLAGASSLTLSPRLLAQPLLASQGFGVAEGYTLTRIVVASSPRLLAYLDRAADYQWTLSRCDIAQSFQPRAWTALSAGRVAIDVPGGWFIGPHSQGQAALLSLQLSERVRYHLTPNGVVRQVLSQPYLTAIASPSLNVWQVQPWHRLGCRGTLAASQFLPQRGGDEDLHFYEVQMGWQAQKAQQGFTMALTLMPLQARGC